MVSISSSRASSGACAYHLEGFVVGGVGTGGELAAGS